MGQLGCASEYAAEIRLRGGRVLWIRLEGITKLSWARKLGDYSEASVTVAKSQAPRACLRRLADVWDTARNQWDPGVHSWSHELTILRDGGIVWQGPVYDITETRSTIEIQARDVLAWMERRIIDVRFQTDPDKPPMPLDAGQVLDRILTQTFPPGDRLNNQNIDWSIVPNPIGVNYVFDKTICQGSALVSKIVYDVAKTGIDLFTLGRRIYLRNATGRFAQAPYRLEDRHFLGDLEVRESGADMCTEGYFYGKQPTGSNAPECALFGAYPNPPRPPAAAGDVREPAGWASAWFGRVSKWAEASQTNDTNTLNAMARNTFSLGWPPPSAVVIPEQGQLAPEAPVTIGQLVPGRPFRVTLPDYVLSRSGATFKLNELEVTWAPPSPEQVQISLVSQQELADKEQ